MARVLPKTLVIADVANEGLLLFCQLLSPSHADGAAAADAKFMRTRRSKSLMV